MVQKIYSKIHFVSCINTHHDVKELVNHEMVKNTNTWISWERNIIFLRNKKILNQCLRWHILRSYHFVAEVNFKILSIPQRTFTCFSKNGHKSTQARCKVCSNLTNVLQQLTVVLLLSFLLTLNNFHDLVLLFKLWKGKYWLKVRRGLFVKIDANRHTPVWLILRSYCDVFTQILI